MVVFLVQPVSVVTLLGSGQDVQATTFCPTSLQAGGAAGRTPDRLGTLDNQPCLNYGIPLGKRHVDWLGKKGLAHGRLGCLSADEFTEFV
jgi:hypothetical protein